MAEIRRTVPVWAWIALGAALSAAAIASPMSGLKAIATGKRIPVQTISRD